MSKLFGRPRRRTVRRAWKLRPRAEAHAGVTEAMPLATGCHPQMGKKMPREGQRVKWTTKAKGTSAIGDL